MSKKYIEVSEEPTTIWGKINMVNNLMKPIELKGKNYIEVKERVMGFRYVFPNGQIIPEITFTDNFVICDCTILDEEGKILSKGHAREYLKVEYALEKCETSAIGRALGFIGLGISTSIASAEDIESVGKSEMFDELPKKDLVEKYISLFTKQEQVDFQNAIHVVDINNASSKLLQALIEFKEDEKFNSR